MAKTALETQLAELERLRARGMVTEEEYAARRSAILADTATPAPKKRGGAAHGLFKWGALGCLGMLAAVGALVVAVVVVIVVALSNAGDDEADSGGDVRVALAEGASGVISAEGNGSKRSKVTILKIVDGAQAGLARPPEGKKYWAVQVEVEAVGTKEVQSLTWKLRDTTSVESDRSFFSGVGENLDAAYTLTPGGKAQGWVVFAIAAEAGPSWLRADPNPFLRNDLYFEK